MPTPLWRTCTKRLTVTPHVHQEADTPAALAGAAWTLGMVQRSAGDTDGALTLARDAATLHWLETAYQTSADSVRYSPTARQMTADAVDHGGPLISRRARSLAGSIGLPL